MKISAQKAFTLIELLVVISIIGILSAIGLVSFQGIRVKAQDAKVKADLNAIKKAYEANYDPTANGGQGGYKQLSADGVTSTYFADGKLPKQPDGTSYTFAYGPDAAVPNNKTDGYRVSSSAPLSDGNTPTVISNQGTVPASQLNSCDPGGVLSNGLVGYWKMDEPASGVGSWNGTTGEVKDYSGNGNGGIAYGTSKGTIAGKYGNAGNFNGSDNYIGNISFSQWDSPVLTISFWFKGSFTSSDQSFYGTNNYWTNGFVAIRNSRAPGECTDNNGLMIYHGADQKLICSYLTPGTWSLLTITFDNTSKNAVLYKNGQQFTTYTFTGNIVKGAAKSLNIGNMWPGTGAFFGQIDDFRIYNRVLSQSEITILANGCVLP